MSLFNITYKVKAKLYLNFACLFKHLIHKQFWKSFFINIKHQLWAKE